MGLFHKSKGGGRVLPAGGGKFSSDSAAEDAALRAGAQGLLQQHSRVNDPDAEALARALATAATAVAERSPEAFAGGLEEVSSR